jgi:hypothetical protein
MLTTERFVFNQIGISVEYPENSKVLCADTLQLPSLTPRASKEAAVGLRRAPDHMPFLINPDGNTVGVVCTEAT